MNVLRLCHRVPRNTFSKENSVGSLASSAGAGTPVTSASDDRCGGPKATINRFGLSGEDGADRGIVCKEAEQRLEKAPVLDYLTQIVFRLYEDRRATNLEDRYRVEVLFSPGATGHPSKAWDNDHMMPLEPLEPLHSPGKPLTLARLQQLITRFVNVKTTGCTTGNTTPQLQRTSFDQGVAVAPLQVDALAQPAVPLGHCDYEL